jgi:hypothetical protein
MARKRSSGKELHTTRRSPDNVPLNGRMLAGSRSSDAAVPAASRSSLPCAGSIHPAMPSRTRRSSDGAACGLGAGRGGAPGTASTMCWRTCAPLTPSTMQ